MQYQLLENMDRAEEVLDDFLREDASVLLECLIDPMDLVK